MKARTYKNNIKENMIKLETYKPEFEKTITTLAKIYENYDEAMEQFEKSGGMFLVMKMKKDGSVETAKNPLYRIIEDMEERILSYNRELGLTPSGYKKIMNKFPKKEKKSGLAAALESLGG